MRLRRSCDILQLTRKSFASSNNAAAAVAIASTSISDIDPRNLQNRQYGSDRHHTTTHFVFGANTDIGKTVLTTALIRAAGAERSDKCDATGKSSGDTTHYIKPLQCGGSDESFVRNHASNYLSSAKTLFEWDTPASPHIAARLEEKPISDEEVLNALSDRLRELGGSSLPDRSTLENNHSTNDKAESSSDSADDESRRPTNRRSIWIETAGGALSPSSSSPKNRAPHHARDNARNWGWQTQADLYKSFRDRSSVVLIGDGRLGGISSTLTTLEALLYRNYNVGGILLIDGSSDGSGNSNLEALREYVHAASHVPSATVTPPPSDCAKSPRTTTGGLFADPEKSVVLLPALPPEPEPLNDWFASSDVQGPMSSFVQQHLFD